MAMIRCPECGKEISSKAVACINCGYPISYRNPSPTNPSPTKPAGGQGVRSDAFAEFFAGVTQKRTVPKEIPEPKLLPGLLIQLLGKAGGMAGLAGVYAIGEMVVNLLAGGAVEVEMLQMGLLGICVSLLLAEFSIRLEARHVKKYLRKNGYEDCIRNDTASWTNSIKAFELYPSMPMAKYVRGLNPDAGNILVSTIRKNQKEKRRKRLGYLPYLGILMVVFYLAPRLEDLTILPYESSLPLCHAAALAVMGVFGYKKNWSFGVIAVVALVFAPVIFAYFYSDMWYHILICGAAAFAGMWLGNRLARGK